MRAIGIVVGAPVVVLRTAGVVVVVLPVVGEEGSGGVIGRWVLFSC